MIRSGLDFVQVVDFDRQIEEVDLSAPLLDRPLEHAATLSVEVVDVVAEAVPSARVSSVVPEAQAVVDEPFVFCIRSDASRIF